MMLYFSRRQPPVDSVHLSVPVMLGLVLTNAAAAADVLLIGRPGPAGPAGWLAAEQIVHWPTQAPLKIVDHDPETISSHTSLIVELTEDFDFRAEMPMSNGATI